MIGIEQPLDDDGGKRGVALSPSLRASRYGRSNSPARAGSSDEAAKPMTVVLSAEPKRTRPTGRSRYCQRAARKQ